jgi:integrase
MPRTSYGTGTIFKRGKVWYVSFWVDGKQVQKSSGSTNIQDAKKLRDQILGKKARGEIVVSESGKVICDELLNDLLSHYDAGNAKATTTRIFRWCIEANLKPFFGDLRAAALSTQKLKQYRNKRKADGVTESTCNRELSILRIALNLGRKCTPPKVLTIPFFPMVREENARQGFLSDQQYAKLRDALPDYLKPLFVTAYHTGVRLGELLAWDWDQVDWSQAFITLKASETKSGHSRAVPILDGDMRKWLEWALTESNGCSSVFHHNGLPIKSFRGTWIKACEAADVPDLKFHDLRRTAVRNMRRAGVPQVVRMRITGHRTDAMERRYNIVDIDDIKSARQMMQERRTDKA